MRRKEDGEEDWKRRERRMTKAFRTIQERKIASGKREGRRKVGSCKMGQRGGARRKNVLFVWLYPKPHRQMPTKGDGLEVPTSNGQFSIHYIGDSVIQL